MNGVVASRAACVLVALGVVACDRQPQEDDGGYEHVIAYDAARVRLARERDTLQLALELAISPDQKRMGLMERRRLADDAGMLFVYDATQPPNAGFWMYRTRIPLDIAFLDSAGVIRSIRSMLPCPTDLAEGCPTYTPDVPYQYALEMNAGFFAKRGVQAGHTLVLQDVPRSPTPNASPRR
jgi:uncharacterized membrane protein (UPF0127 family)